MFLRHCFINACPPSLGERVGTAESVDSDYIVYQYRSTNAPPEPSNARARNATPAPTLLAGLVREEVRRAARERRWCDRAFGGAVQVDVRLTPRLKTLRKRLLFQVVESASLASQWFQMATRTSTRRARRRRRRRRQGMLPAGAAPRRGRAPKRYGSTAGSDWSQQGFTTIP